MTPGKGEGEDRGDRDTSNSLHFNRMERKKNSDGEYRENVEGKVKVRHNGCFLLLFAGQC